MDKRNVFRSLLLLALAGPLHAQEFTNLLWPPRDVGANESFGVFGVFGGSGIGLGGNVLAVRDARNGENVFVRVYVREGLNWIEDGRLCAVPRTPFVQATLDDAFSIDVDAGRVLVSGKGHACLYTRVAARKWSLEELSAPPNATGANFGARVALSGDWMAVATDAAVELLQHQGLGQGSWVPVQEVLLAFPAVVDLDGSELAIASVEGVRTFHLDGGTWTQEFTLGSGFNLTGFDGDKLCVLETRTSLLQAFDRVGSSWLPGGTLGLRGLAPFSAALSGDRMYMSQNAKLRIFDIGAQDWTEVGEVASPYPSFCSYRDAGVVIDGSTLVVHSGAEPYEHLNGVLSTFDLSGATHATLHASTAQMELESGGTLTLELDAGPAKAGAVYFLKGSLTGTSPGFERAGVRIPLDRRADPYFPLCRYRGVLDGAGRASIPISIPALAPGDPLCDLLKDRTLHHVFFLWERGHGLTNVSNVALTALVGRAH